MKIYILPLLSLFLFVFHYPVSGQTDNPKPVVKTPVYFDISPALRDVLANPPGIADRTWKDGIVKNIFNFRIPKDASGMLNSPDPEVQTYFGTSQTATTLQNFEGISNTQGYVPPDTDGDVGPNHYFQVVNCQYKIFSKTGATLYGPVNSSTMWTGFPNNANSGDAVVLYDEQADRWFFSQFSLPNYPNGPFYMMIAVSQTPDPLGVWYRWQYSFTDMPDYPKFGIWPDGYYMSINRFSAGSTNWNGIGAVAFDRTAMIAGNAAAQMVMFTLPASDEAGSLLPSDCDGAFPVSGTPNYFTYINDGPDHLKIFEFHVDWTTPTNSTFSSPASATMLAVNAFSSSIGTGIPQPGTSVRLDALSDRLMFRLQYRKFSDHEAMVTNHSVNANITGSNNAGVRWYELRKTTGAWSIYQQGTYAPDAKSRWMGSIALDASGNIALGYSVSDATSTYPSIRYTGRMANDPLNQMTLTENTIINGAGSQTHGSGRWGDYSSLRVDPSAPNTFWYTTEYYSSTSSSGWKTRVASLLLAPGMVPGIIIANQSICHNTMPSVLTATPPTGGTPPYSYQWQSSPNNTVFSNIAGATTLTYQPGNLTSTTWYRQNQTSAAGGGSVNTNVVTITVYPVFNAGSIAANQSICYNTTPALLTGTAPTGGTTPYAYQWQSSPNNSVFSNIPGATSLNYQPGALTATIYYRLVQTSAAGCGSLNTNVVTIAVYPTFAAGSISASQIICFGAVPALLTGTNPTGGNTPYTYQWQSSPNNSVFSNIPGATSLDYQPGALTATSYFRMVQTSTGGCGSLNTNVVTITVYPAFATGSISASQSICYNTIPAMLSGTAPTGGNTPYIYQWQSSPNNSVFSNIPGATSLNYQPGALTATSYYRLVQTSAGGCGSLNTNVITITVYTDFIAGNITANQNICYNTIPALLTGTAPTGGAMPYTYQWQISPDNTTFTNISGATGLNYQPGALTATRYYRLVQTSANGCGSMNTNVVTITVLSNFIPGSISANQGICYNTAPATLNTILPTGGTPPYSYQWQSSSDYTVFSNIAGATTVNYQPGALTSTTWYRQGQFATGVCDTGYTNIVTIIVYPNFIAGTISANQSICYNTTPALLAGIAPIGGKMPYTYQWQSSPDNSNFTNISGATGLNYQPGVLTSTKYYRLVQTSAAGCGSLNTNVITIIVYPEFIAGTISANQTICYNTIPASLTGTAPSGGSLPYTYQWQISPDNTTFTNISGATGLNYQPGALTATKYYRLVQTSAGGCGMLNTNVVTITIYPAFAPGTIGSNQAICYNTTPAQLTGTTPSGGTVPYGYQWQNSPDSSVFSTIPGATSLNYQPGALTSTRYYRLVQTSSGGCGSLNTNVVTITVYPAFAPGTIGSNQAICYSTAPAQLTGTTPSGGTAPYGYQWQTSANNATFTNITGATNLSYQPGVLTATRYYRLVQTSSGGCGSLNTNVVTITVYPAFAPGTIGSNQAICYNTAPAQLTGTTPSGGTAPYGYQWQTSANNATFTNITGATNLTYQPGVLTATHYYRLVQTSSGGCGSLNTNVVTITVYPVFTAGTLNSNQAICFNTAPALLTGTAPSGGTSPYSYQWQISPDNTTFTNISGATGLNYQPGALTATKYYRLVQTSSGGCGSLSTNVVTIAVYPAFAAGTIGSNQSICYNTAPVHLTGTAPSGGTAPYGYQWQTSADNATFTNIAGATNLTYQPGVLTATRYYRLVQTSSGGCGSLNTNVVTIAVYPVFTPGTIAANQTINYNTTPDPLTGTPPSGGNVPYSYQWYSSTDGVIFHTISGATNLNHSPGTLTDTTWYRQLQSSASGCGSYVTNVIKISVNPPPVITVTSPDGGENWLQGSTYQIIWTDNIAENVRIELFKGGSFSVQIIGSTPSTGTYSWTIPTNQQPGNDYRIKITSTTDNIVTDYSNADFTISRVVPPILTIQNVTVLNGQTVCFDATQTIMVAGGGNAFIVHNGGSATLIAGQNILYYPGTTVQSGGFMHGYIAPGGPYCGGLTPSIVTVVTGEEEFPTISIPFTAKIYPNPNTGAFTLELKGDFVPGNIKAEIFSMHGEKVNTTEMRNETKHEFSLIELPAGFYFIRIIAGEKVETVKFIKH